MGKTLKSLAGGINDNHLAQTVKDSAQQIWLAGLGAFAKAQEEGGKVFEALVKEGEGLQARTRKITDDKIAVVTSKATGTWDRLEQVFEERVARSLGSLGVPSKKEIEHLTKRVSELTIAVQALSGGKAPAKLASKPVVKAAVKPVAKPAAKSAAKPALKASAKVVAKPAAKAPAAVATKATAKPAAKPAAKVTKPAVSKPAAPKAAAKPAPVAAKKTAVPAVTPADVLKTIVAPGT